ncbi:MAG: copper chaperone PCu(A)C [Alphaproteobacteria bacterium]|jgi:copper(I)-binding protein
MMKTLFSILTLTFGLVMGLAPLPQAHAADATIAGITFSGAWARASTGGGRPSAAYLTIINKGASDVLSGASSPLAERVEIHQSKMENGVMRMNKAEPLEIPNGAKLAMKPGGYHIMIMRLKQPLKMGDTVTLTLHLKNAGDVTIHAPVKHAAAAHGHGESMKHKMK